MLYQIDSSKYIAINQYSGAINIFSKKWWDELVFPNFLSENFHEELPDLRYYQSMLDKGLLTFDEFQTLQDLGYFLTEELRLLYETKVLEFGKTKAEIRPHTFFITPQISCPLGCVYCFEKDARSNSDKKIKLNTKDLDFIEEFIEEYRTKRGLDSDKITVVIFGGEPLVSNLKEFNRCLLEIIERNGYYWRINTSGYTMDDEYLKLIESNKKMLQEVDITIDGSETIHNKIRPLASGKGTYNQIKNNVERLLDSEIRVMVKTNLGRETIDNLALFLREQINYGWFKNPFYLFGTNVVRSFGGTSDGGQQKTEDYLIIRLIELFKSKDFDWLLPKVRFEGMRLTEYLASSLNLLTFVNSSGEIINKFDAYPKHAFCHPTDGTTLNISYDGNVYTCNWMAGKKKFSTDNIFERDVDADKKLEKLRTNVMSRRDCKACSISTLCGGGCSIDREEVGNYGNLCFPYSDDIIKNFISTCITKGWVDMDLCDKNIKILSRGFMYNYRYENRVQNGINKIFA